MKLTEEQAKERAALIKEYRETNDDEVKERIKNDLLGKGFKYVEGPLGESQAYFLTPKEYEDWEFFNKDEKPSFRYNIVFLCILDWEGEKSEEVGRYESNHPFPDLDVTDDVKIKGKHYGVTAKRVEFDPGESLVVIYEVFCKDVPTTEGDDEE